MSELIESYLYELNEGEYLEEFVVIALIGLIKIYQNYLSKAAKECKQTSPKDKRRCMLKYKISGKHAQLKYLKQKNKECIKSKNKEKCIKKIQKHTEKIKKDIEKLLQKHLILTKKLKTSKNKS